MDYADLSSGEGDGGTPMIQDVAHGEITQDNDIEIPSDKVIEMEIEPMPSHSERLEVQATGQSKP